MTASRGGRRTAGKRSGTDAQRDAEVEAIVGGKAYRLTREQVTQRLKGVSPGPVREHTVAVGGVLYPVKQALAVATGVDTADFNTTQARSVLRRLGFTVQRRGADLR